MKPDISRVPGGRISIGWAYFWNGQPFDQVFSNNSHQCINLVKQLVNMQKQGKTFSLEEWQHTVSSVPSPLFNSIPRPLWYHHIFTRAASNLHSSIIGAFMLLPSAKPKIGPGKLMSASTIKSARLLLQWQNTIDIGLVVAIVVHSCILTISEMYYRIFTRSLQTDTLLPHCTQQTQLWVATVKLLAHSYLCCNSTTAAQFRIRGKTTELIELLDVSKLATKQTKQSWNKVLWCYVVPFIIDYVSSLYFQVRIVLGALAWIRESQKKTV